MATTQKGIYYPSDYNAIADIPADMKQMAESVNKAIVDSEYNDTEIKQNIIDMQAEQITQNENIQKNEIIITKLEEEIEILADLIPTGQASGESITVNDSAKYKFKKIEIGGKSIQEGEPTPTIPIDIRNVGESGSVGILAQNGNKFNGKFLNGQLSNTTGEFYASSNSVASEDFIKISANKTVYFSNNGVAANVNVYKYNLDRSFIGKEVTANKYTCTEDCLIKFTKGNTNYDKFQVEYDGVTDYIEHQEQIVTFPLSEGQLLHQGDYLAKDGIHIVRNKRIIDGTETNWTYYSAGDTWARPYLQISNKKTGEDDSTANVMSNKFKSTSWNDGRLGVFDDYGVFSYSGDKRISFLIKKTDLSSLDATGVKEYFTNNPTIIEYNLAEEIVIPYTSEQEEAYRKIKELYSYTGITNITCTDEISCNFNIVYRKDFTIAQDNLQKQIDEIKASLVTSEVVE